MHLTTHQHRLTNILSIYLPFSPRGKHTKPPHPLHRNDEKYFVILSPRARREDASGLARLALTQAIVSYGFMRTPNLLSDSDFDFLIH
jgi:hypothetical protein